MNDLNKKDRVREQERVKRSGSDCEIKAKWL